MNLHGELKPELELKKDQIGDLQLHDFRYFAPDLISGVIYCAALGVAGIFPSHLLNLIIIINYLIG